MYTSQVDWAVVDAVQRVAAVRGVSMAQVALAWLLSRPAVTAPIVGATKLAQLEDGIAAVELELTPEECAMLEAGYTPHPVIGH
jgi:aryl-alcohol dehydrogenase-like predicted oxidoreductase